jgi:hypothetical protein
MASPFKHKWILVFLVGLFGDLSLFANDMDEIKRLMSDDYPAVEVVFGIVSKHPAPHGSYISYKLAGDQTDSKEASETSGTNYYLGIISSNQTLCMEIASPDAVNEPINASLCKGLYSRSNSAQYILSEYLLFVTPGPNEDDKAVSFFGGNILACLHMGLTKISYKTISWNGDEFIGSQDNTDVEYVYMVDGKEVRKKGDKEALVRGRIVRNADGQVVGLRLEGQVRVEFGFSDTPTVPKFVPTSIRTFVGEDSTEILNITIYKLKLFEQALPDEAFDPSRLLKVGTFVHALPAKPISDKQSGTNQSAANSLFQVIPTERALAEKLRTESKRALQD